MHFTLVFSSHESYDLTLSLTFEPCPIWRRGGTLVLNPHPQFPEYANGDFATVMRLLGPEYIDGLAKGPRKVLVVKHSEGHGTLNDFQRLLEDLKGTGFKVQSVDL